MTRKHGQTSYFIVDEGFVGDEAAREEDGALGGALGAGAEPDATDDPERAFRFTRMFPELPRFRPAVEALIELGQVMDDTPNFKDHPTLAAGFTYFGQFLDHDITFDRTAGLPSGELSPEEIRQGRSPSLDLDSVYGRGPGLEEKRLYEADGVHLRVGRTTGLGTPGVDVESQDLPSDLPRGDNPANGREATIGDPRNDENLAVAQLHLAFLKFHNVVAARLAETGLSGAELFERARATVVRHYQWVVLYDFLPQVVDRAVLSGVIRAGTRFFRPAEGDEPAMPIEFSVAAYRFGHSMIRDSYSWNRNFPDASLGLLFSFSAVNGDLGGFNTLPSNWPVDWRRFFDMRAVAGLQPMPPLNTARSIDTGLALTLREIPEFRNEGARAPLAVRNLLRARILGLPSGQSVAQTFNFQPLSPEQLRSGPHERVLRQHGFDRETPLWYYVLKEAEVFNDGLRLGPVGSLLLAETFVGLVQRSRHSILAQETRHWRPTLPGVRPGHFTMADLLLLVNDLNPLGDERPLIPPPPPPVIIHVVQPGESLRIIARRFLGDERRWREIFEANRDVISNPDIIRPGMRLVIPVR